MIITSWNIRGLNSKGKQRYLKERLKKDRPSIMIIQETKMRHHQMEEFIAKTKLNYEVMTQDAKGAAGGWAILLNPEEIIFENWVSMPRILTGRFRVIGAEERILL